VGIDPARIPCRRILHRNKIRDIDTDLLDGKRTLATFLAALARANELLRLGVLAYASVIRRVMDSHVAWIGSPVFITVRARLNQLRIVFRETDRKQLNLRPVPVGATPHGVRMLMMIAFLIAAFMRW